MTVQSVMALLGAAAVGIAAGLVVHTVQVWWAQRRRRRRLQQFQKVLQQHIAETFTRAGLVPFESVAPEEIRIGDLVHWHSAPFTPPQAVYTAGFHGDTGGFTDGIFMRRMTAGQERNDA